MSTRGAAREVPFTTVFGHALAGEETHLMIGSNTAVRVPMEDWTRAADDADRALLALCTGPTLDVGCGPGRLTAELAANGHIALGIDVVAEAVEETRGRGATALHRDIFGRVPGEGRWETALLADGNIGIGGDPAGLLRRLRRLLAPTGRVVTDVAEPGIAGGTVEARLRCSCLASAPFPWSVVGVDDIAGVALEAGLRVAATGHHQHRWWAVLERAA